MRETARETARQIQLRETPPEPITIEDYSSQSTLWANDVGISDYKVIAQSYAVYHIVLLMRTGARVDLWRRYSEFDQLGRALELAKPLAVLPPLPPKSLLNRLDSAFLDSRRLGLEFFLKSVVLNPDLCECPLVKEFFMR